MATDNNKDERERGIYRVTLAGSLCNFILLAFKFIAGIIGNSAAMIADAVHSLSDFVTDIIVLVFVRISSRPEDKDHDYGHGKYETLATALIGIMLFAVGIGILWNGASSIARFLQGEILPQPGGLALAAALVSIAVKEILYHYTAIRGKQLDSPSVVANAWHHRSDALSSIGTATGIAGAIMLGEKWRVLDPLAAVIVSCFIIKVAIQLLKPCIDELVERSLPEDVEERINRIVLSCPNVSSPHHLRTRRIGNHYAIEMHVRLPGDMPLSEAHSISTEMEKKLRLAFGPETHVCIHLEPEKK